MQSIELVPWLATSVFFGILDYRFRIVKNQYTMGIALGGLLSWLVYPPFLVDIFLVSLTWGMAILYWRFKWWGGGDSKAVMALAVLAPGAYTVVAVAVGSLLALGFKVRGDRGQPFMFFSAFGAVVVWLSVVFAGHIP